MTSNLAFEILDQKSLLEALRGYPLLIAFLSQPQNEILVKGWDFELHHFTFRLSAAKSPLKK